MDFVGYSRLPQAAGPRDVTERRLLPDFYGFKAETLLSSPRTDAKPYAAARPSDGFGVPRWEGRPAAQGRSRMRDVFPEEPSKYH